MKNNISKSDFTFKQTSYGAYRVTFYSKLGKWWERDITDMELIDAVKNTPEPTKAAMNRLKRAVKNYSLIKGNLFASKKQKPTYKLSVEDGESDYMRDELDYFLEQHELTFVASHKRYRFPTNLAINFNSFEDWESIEKYLKKEGYKHIQPVYMLDHSMLAFSLGRFGGYHGYFDSGQIGFLASTEKGRKGQKAFKLYSEFLSDLEDYFNNNVKRIELIDENGAQIECIECFDNRLNENINWLKKTYKNAKIIESE